MKVSYSPRALRQLEKIHAYIAQFNPRAAREVIARIEELCEKLGEFPSMGHLTEIPGVRILPVVRYPYLIFYTLIAESEEVRTSDQARTPQTARSGRGQGTLAPVTDTTPAPAVE